MADKGKSGMGSGEKVKNVKSGDSLGGKGKPSPKK